MKVPEPGVLCPLVVQQVLRVSAGEMSKKVMLKTPDQRFR